MRTFEELYNRLPEVLRNTLETCEQDSIYHPEGEVSKHIQSVFEYAQEHYPGDDDLLVSAIFHDLGKLDTQTSRTLPNGREKISNIGHEFHAERYIDKYINLYSDITTNGDKIKEICLYHMRAGLYDNGVMTKKSKRQKLESLKYFDDLMKFTKCDRGGKILIPIVKK